MFSPLRFLALITFLKTLGKLKFYVELHQKTANCCIKLYFAKKTFVKFLLQRIQRSKMSLLCKFSFPTHKLTDFSVFKMVYSPKTFLNNLFEMLINISSPKWAQMVYVVNNLCWLAT